VTAEPPLRRSDAARNRELVLAAATTAFAEQGLTVPLTEIAGRAGVGVGTVYRHFPTKEALFSAVLSARISGFARTARGLVGRVEPGAAFFCFLYTAIETAVLNSALCAELAGQLDQVTAAHEASRAEYRALLATLLAGAQRAGAVRADVAAADVSALIAGCLVAVRQRGDATRPARLATLLCAGLPAPGGAPLPDWATVTKLWPTEAEPAADRHETSHETRPATGHESRQESGRLCATCGWPITVARTGRPARFCGPTCRQRAHRAAAGAASPSANSAGPGSGTPATAG
jgi:AcrR family transcriptional regulator